MVQAYEVEKSGGGVWMLLTPQEFDIIFERFLRGMEARGLRDEEAARNQSAHALCWSWKLRCDWSAEGAVSSSQWKYAKACRFECWAGSQLWPNVWICPHTDPASLRGPPKSRLCHHACPTQTSALSWGRWSHPSIPRIRWHSKPHGSSSLEQCGWIAIPFWEALPGPPDARARTGGVSEERI